MAHGEAQPLPEQLRNELNARFHDALMRFFQRRFKGRAEAEDLTQEVLLRVINASNQNTIEQPEHFVFRVAMNLLRDTRRQNLRDGQPAFVPIDKVLKGELEGQLVEGLSPERVLMGRESIVDVLRTLDELGELTRNIFVLFRVERMKQKDIAALYGLGLSTVEKHVMKATLHLYTRYGRK